MTSPGVKKELGNHNLNSENYPDKRLKQTFNSIVAKENGRLNATIYNYINPASNQREN